jgi:hypothetical protein
MNGIEKVVVSRSFYYVMKWSQDDDIKQLWKVIPLIYVLFEDGLDQRLIHDIYTISLIVPPTYKSFKKQ